MMRYFGRFKFYTHNGFATCWKNGPGNGDWEIFYTLTENDGLSPYERSQKIAQM